MLWNAEWSQFRAVMLLNMGGGRNMKFVDIGREWTVAVIMAMLECSHIIQTAVETSKSLVLE